MMNVERRKNNNNGSVWENRIKQYDGNKGVIKALINTNQTHENHSSQETITTATMSDKNDCETVQEENKKLLLGNGKRKSWKSESFDGNPNPNSRKRSDLCKNLDEQCNDLSVKSPIQSSRKRSDLCNEQCNDLSVKNPVQNSRKRSDLCKNNVDENCRDLSVMKSPTSSSPSPSSIQSKKTRSTMMMISPVQLRKVKSESSKALIPTLNNDDDSNSLALVKAKSAPIKDLKFECEESKSEENNDNNKARSEEETNDVCEEKVITGNVELALVKSPSEVENNNLQNQEQQEDDEEEDEDEDDVKKMIIHKYEKSVPLSPILKKQPSTSKQVPIREEFHSDYIPQSRLQSLVDLVMWRDASKSALVFGVGTFLIISSSYTHDIKVSLISVISYMSLLYLALIFLFRSLIQRGRNGDETSECVVGEEEAIWVLKMILPYLNEFLSKIRALFSGDPATTMKMAVLLFVLAQCGSSITILKMAKLGFFGVFTVPKICSSYSTQFTAYGKFWIRRFRDAWESCTHKKAVAFGIFTLVWNLSSFVARIWAAFMLYVAFRYYQEKMVKGEWNNGDEGTTSVKQEEEIEAKIGQRRVGRKSTFMDTRKQKKPL